MQPEEEKKNIACPAAGLEDDFVFRFMCFCSAIEDSKLHLENIYSEMLSVTEGGRGSHLLLVLVF